MRWQVRSGLLDECAAGGAMSRSVADFGPLDALRDDPQAPPRIANTEYAVYVGLAGAHV